MCVRAHFATAVLKVKRKLTCDSQKHVCQVSTGGYESPEGSTGGHESPALSRGGHELPTGKHR